MTEGWREPGAVAMIRLALGVTLALGLASAQARPRHKVPTAPPLPAKVAEILAVFDRGVADLTTSFRSREPPQPKDPIWVARALRYMAEIEQRQAYLLQDADQLSASERVVFEPERQRRVRAVHEAQIKTLKALVALHGWFTISGFGKQADADASFLVRSTFDLPFQRKILAALRPLAAQHETNTANLAYLEDQVVVFGDRKQQRFGTLGYCVAAGKWMALPIDDAPHVDQRRQSVGLEPLAKTQAELSTSCKEATPPPR